MDTSSLRIGNIVHVMNRSNKIHMPNTLTDFRIVGLSLGKASLTPNRMIGFEENFKEVSAWDLVPVTLTEDWVTSFGFTKMKHAWNDKSITEDSFWLGKYNIELPSGQPPFLGRVDNMNEPVWLCNIEHVHQLQNLYFALTQEDLKFTISEKAV